MWGGVGHFYGKTMLANPNVWQAENEGEVLEADDPGGMEEDGTLNLIHLRTSYYSTGFNALAKKKSAITDNGLKAKQALDDHTRADPMLLNTADRRARDVYVEMCRSQFALAQRWLGNTAADGASASPSSMQSTPAKAVVVAEQIKTEHEAAQPENQKKVLVAGAEGSDAKKGTGGNEEETKKKPGDVQETKQGGVEVEKPEISEVGETKKNDDEERLDGDKADKVVPPEEEEEEKVSVAAASSHDGGTHLKKAKVEGLQDMVRGMSAVYHCFNVRLLNWVLDFSECESKLEECLMVTTEANLEIFKAYWTKVSACNDALEKNIKDAGTSLSKHILSVASAHQRSEVKRRRQQDEAAVKESTAKLQKGVDAIQKAKEQAALKIGTFFEHVDDEAKHDACSKLQASDALLGSLDIALPALLKQEQIVVGGLLG